jgi:hypothetical protein
MVYQKPNLKWCYRRHGRPRCYNKNIKRWTYISEGKHSTDINAYHPDEVYSKLDGSDYLGTVGYTMNGKKCKDWRYHNVGDYQGSSYTKKNLRNSKQLSSNYCRNPNEDTIGAWCYTNLGKEYCDISRGNTYLVATQRELEGKYNSSAERENALKAENNRIAAERAKTRQQLKEYKSKNQALTNVNTSLENNLDASESKLEAAHLKNERANEIFTELNSKINTVQTAAHRVTSSSGLMTYDNACLNFRGFFNNDTIIDANRNNDIKLVHRINNIQPNTVFATIKQALTTVSSSHILYINKFIYFVNIPDTYFYNPNQNSDYTNVETENTENTVVAVFIINPTHCSSTTSTFVDNSFKNNIIEEFQTDFEQNALEHVHTVLTNDSSSTRSNNTECIAPYDCYNNLHNTTFEQQTKNTIHDLLTHNDANIPITKKPTVRFSDNVIFNNFPVLKESNNIYILFIFALLIIFYLYYYI